MLYFSCWRSLLREFLLFGFACMSHVEEIYILLQTLMIWLSILGFFYFFSQAAFVSKYHAIFLGIIFLKIL